MGVRRAHPGRQANLSLTTTIPPAPSPILWCATTRAGAVHAAWWRRAGDAGLAEPLPLGQDAQGSRPVLHPRFCRRPRGVSFALRPLCLVVIFFFKHPTANSHSKIFIRLLTPQHHRPSFIPIPPPCPAPRPSPGDPGNAGGECRPAPDLDRDRPAQPPGVGRHQRRHQRAVRGHHRHVCRERGPAAAGLHVRHAPLDRDMPPHPQD